MLRFKNTIMLRLGMIGIVLSGLIRLLHMYIPMQSNSEHGTHASAGTGYFYALFGITIALWLLAFLQNRRSGQARLAAVVNTLLFTFISFTMIAAGEGMSVYHFSVFMVVAVVSFYEDIQLILLMTVLFALQHILGFAVPALTPVVFGVKDYTLIMVVLHAVYLLLTSGATSWQIAVKNGYMRTLEREQEAQAAMVQQLYEQLGDASKRVVHTADQLQEQVQRTAHASESVSQSVQDMTIQTAGQAAVSETGTRTVQEMVTSMQKVSEAAELVNRTSRDSSQKAEEGYAAVRAVLQQMQRIQASVGDVTGKVRDLEAQSQQIGQTIEVITQIADQTNMLSLNASIEAARAGEQGRGFAVVAEEVRKLAEQSASAAQQITNLVKDVQSKTDSAVQSAEHGLQEAERGVAVIQQAGNSFTDILAVTKEAADETLDMTSSITELAQKSNDILSSIQEIEGAAAELERMSASIVSANREQAASVHTISGIVEELNDFSKDLDAVTKQLK